MMVHHLSHLVMPHLVMSHLVMVFCLYTPCYMSGDSTESTLRPVVRGSFALYLHHSTHLILLMLQDFHCTAGCRGCLDLPVKVAELACAHGLQSQCLELKHRGLGLKEAKIKVSISKNLL
jgi:hypothetical protein